MAVATAPPFSTVRQQVGALLYSATALWDEAGLEFEDVASLPHLLCAFFGLILGGVLLSRPTHRLLA